MPNIDLGTVTFALAAATKDLERVIPMMNKVSERVNQLRDQNTEAADAMANHWAQVELTLGNTFNKANEVLARMERSGVAKDRIDELGASIRELSRQMSNIKPGEDLGREHFNRIRINVNGIVGEAQREIKASEEVRRAYIEDARLTQKALEEKTAAIRREAERVKTIEQARDTELHNRQQKAIAEERAIREKAIAEQKAVIESRDLWLHKQAAAAAAEAINIERNIGIQAAKVRNLNVAAQKVGVSEDITGANVTALGKLQTAVTSKDARETVKAQLDLRDAMQRTRNEIDQLKHSGSLLSVTFRDLSRASIIAMGPLSGVGSRLSVISALFESSSVSMALFVIGAAGITTVLGLMASAGIKATMEMQKLDAMFTASTGSAALAASSYQYVTDQANKFGVSVKALAEPFAKFETSARLSGMTMEQEKKTFEGIITASTAMRLDNQRTGLVFMAFEQMMNKGVVSMEELRRQLGDLIPGAFEIAAQSMGKTQAEFAKMVSTGQVLSADLIPKMTQKFAEIFGPASQKAAQSLQGELGRLQTSLFMVQKAFDDATKFSEMFRDAVKLAREALDGLASNMQRVVAVFGAFMGAGGVLAAVAILSRVPAAIAAITVSVKELLVVIEAGSVSLTVLSALFTGGASLIVRLGLAAAGATSMFFLLDKQVDKSKQGTIEFLEKTREWIEISEKLGKASWRAWEEEKKAVQERLTFLGLEIEAQTTLLQLQEEKDAKTRKATESSLKFHTLGVRGAGPVAPENPETVQMRKELEERRRLFEQFKAVADKIAGMAHEERPKNEPIPSTAFDNWIKGIKKQMRDVETAQSEVKEFMEGRGAVSMETIKARDEAWNKAIDTFKAMPAKGSGSFDDLSKQLSKFNVDTKKTAEEWANLPTGLKEGLEKASPAVIEFISRLKAMDEAGTNAGITQKALAEQVRKQEDAIKKVSELRSALDTRMQAAAEADKPEHIKAVEGIAKAVDAYRKALVESNKFTYEAVDAAAAKFEADMRMTLGMEDAAKATLKLQSQMERLQNTLGDKTERIAERVRDQLDLVAQAMASSDPKVHKTIEEGAALQEKIINQGYLDTLKATQVFGKDMRTLMTSLENDLAKGFADLFMGGKTGFKEMFDKILRDALEWMAKMTIIAPVMKALFGGIFTGKNADAGTGIFEGFLRRMIPGLGAPITPAESLAQGIIPVAKGGIFNSLGLSGLSGGVFNSPTFFKFAKGGGVLGEAGPEAVLPLTRDSSGKLGVTQAGGSGGISVQVNVINQSGTQVQAQQQGPAQFDGQKWVVSVLLDAIQNNPRVRNSMAGALR